MPKRKSNQKKPKEKALIGRPTKYKESYVADMKVLMAQGFKDIQIMSEWGISADTFYRWLKEKEDLKKAYDDHLPMCQDFWERVGFEAMMGQIKGFKENIWKSFMKTKFDDWKDDPTTVEDNRQVINNYIGMDKDTLLEQIQKKIRINHLEEEE